MSAAALGGIERQLRDIQARIRQLRLNALGQGTGFGANEVAPTLPEARAYALHQEIAPILLDLRQVQRELKDIEAKLDLRERRALRKPREARRRERQSISSTREREGRVYQLLIELIDELRNIWGNRAPSAQEIRGAVITGAWDFQESWQEHIKFAAEFQSIVEAPPGPSISAPFPSTVQNVSFVTLAAFAVILAAALTRRKSG